MDGAGSRVRGVLETGADATCDTLSWTIGSESFGTESEIEDRLPPAGSMGPLATGADVRSGPIVRGSGGGGGEGESVPSNAASRRRKTGPKPLGLLSFGSTTARPGRASETADASFSRTVPATVAGASTGTTSPTELARTRAALSLTVNSAAAAGSTRPSNWPANGRAVAHPDDANSAADSSRLTQAAKEQRCCAGRLVATRSPLACRSVVHQPPQPLRLGSAEPRGRLERELPVFRRSRDQASERNVSRLIESSVRSSRSPLGVSRYMGSSAESGSVRI